MIRFCNEFGKWRAYVIWCHCFGAFEGAVHQNCVVQRSAVREYSKQAAKEFGQ